MGILWEYHGISWNMFVYTCTIMEYLWNIILYHTIADNVPTSKVISDSIFGHVLSY